MKANIAYATAIVFAVCATYCATHDATWCAIVLLLFAAATTIHATEQ